MPPTNNPPHPGDDVQRDMERRALRNVRQLVDKIERSDEVDERTQRKLLVGIVAGAFAVALVIAIAVFFSVEKREKVVIDPAKLPPVQAGPRR